MLTKPKECVGCPLYDLGQGFSRPTGSGALGVLVVAEALGRHEAREGRPLVEWADAGSMFQRALDKAGFDREQFALWNIIGCQPPSNLFEHMPWEWGAAQHCQVHFKEVVNQFRPRAIFAMGNVALKHLTGMTGKNRTVTSLRGYVLRGEGVVKDIPVISSYHPSYLRRGSTNLFRVYTEDLIRAVRVAQGEDLNFDLVPAIPAGFNLNPTERDVRDLLEQIRANPPGLRLSYDIETSNTLEVDEGELFKFDSDKGGEDDETTDIEETQEEQDERLAKIAAGPIVQVQFSLAEDHALSIPWTPKFIPAIKEVLESGCRKVGHNAWRFDDKMLRASGIRVGGTRADTLWMWHHSQPDLPAHLQFVASHFGQRFPWKHLSGADLAFYGAVDVAVLHRIVNRLPERMRGMVDRRWEEFAAPHSIEIRSIWEGYERMVEDLNPILERMSDRGLPMDKEALDQFEKDVQELKVQTYAELCELYPTELLPAKQKLGLKKVPKEILDLEDELRGDDPLMDVAEMSDLAQEVVWKRLGYLVRNFEDDIPIYKTERIPCSCKKGKVISTTMETKVALSPKEFEKFEKLGCKKCSKSGYVEKKEVVKTIRGWERRWYKPMPFKPSSTQITTYIKFMGHTLPTRATMKKEATGSREKATTDKTALAQLARKTKDPFYDLVVKFRNYEKLISTYVKGWQPKLDGRVHSSFLFRPATGQLSSVGPNVQNSPGEKGGELSVRFKDCIRARPGRTLVELDWTGLHAYMLGFLANDPSYMRLSRLGIHDFLAANILKMMIDSDGVEKAAKSYARMIDPKSPTVDYGLIDATGVEVSLVDKWLGWGDDVLAAKLNWIKSKHKVFRSKIKPAVHGYGFGLGAFKLFKGYPDNFATIREAQAPLTMLNNLFPIVAQYREDIKEKADREGCLISPFGAIRHFYNVFDKRPVSPNHIPRYGEKLYVSGRSGKTYKITGGMDAEKAIAFLPANCSFGYVKDSMLELAKQELDEKYCLVNQVHDSLLFECLDEQVDECVEEVLDLMQAPSTYLVSPLAPEGLRCYASASVGKRWGQMKEL